MEYNKVIAVTGLPGLYELLSSKSDGAIVRALDDKTTRFVSSRIHNFSHLESIEVYTVRDNVNLVDILKAMEASSEKLPDDKDNAALKSYFGKVYPDLDFDRVYSSDLKKMVKWFSVLKANDIEIKLSEVPAEEEAETAEAEVEEAPAPKKKAAAKEEKNETAKSEEKPAKKAAKAEVKAEEEEKPKAKKSAAAKSEEKPAPKKKRRKPPKSPLPKSQRRPRQKEINTCYDTYSRIDET
ncbi:DUF5606 domain-containing protein [Puia sp. P3]|uniref:DUF5606 family protein n=1 Tax=Puia sp. P3 TaxID=3423952 RepID=UPI003D6659F5